MPLPTSANDPSLRSNLGKWAVPTCRLPAVAHFLHDVLPNEPFDPHFLGQHLTTTYFDTEDFTLRKARVDGERYFVLRLRCYGPPAGQPDTAELYALSVKTEAEKWRTEINAEHAALILAGQGQAMIRSHLPSHLLARLQQLIDFAPLLPVAQTSCRRYAVEGRGERYTLDVDVHSDAGKQLPFHVLEFKAVESEAAPASSLAFVGLRPLKISKFLWSTTP